MGEAREVMNRVTEVVEDGDLGALKELYAPDAVAESPDAGTISGRARLSRGSRDSWRRFRTRRGSLSTNTNLAIPPSTRGT